MSYKVLLNFKCEKKHYKVGDLYQGQLSDLLLSKGLIELMESPADENPSELVVGGDEGPLPPLPEEEKPKKKKKKG